MSKTSPQHSMVLGYSKWEQKVVLKMKFSTCTLNA